MLRKCRQISDRTFSVAAPRAWNRLPTQLKLLRSTTTFCCQLKTFLFQSAYGHQETDCFVMCPVGGAIQVSLLLLCDAGRKWKTAMHRWRRWHTCGTESWGQSPLKTKIPITNFADISVTRFICWLTVIRVYLSAQWCDSCTIVFIVTSVIFISHVVMFQFWRSTFRLGIYVFPLLARSWGWLFKYRCHSPPPI